VATIKYYLREGLMPRGDKAATNQADYGDAHLERLRLIRVMRDVGGLSVDVIRQVCRALDGPTTDYDLLGITHYALSHRPPPTPADAEVGAQAGANAAADQLYDFLSGLGWHIRRDSPAWLDLVESYLAVKSAWPSDWGSVEPPDLLHYARAAQDIARVEMPERRVVMADSARRDESLKRVILGTVLFEPLILAMRRLAQQDRAAKLLDSS